MGKLSDLSGLNAADFTSDAARRPVATTTPTNAPSSTLQKLIEVFDAAVKVLTHAAQLGLSPRSNDILENAETCADRALLAILEYVPQSGTEIIEKLHFMRLRASGLTDNSDEMDQYFDVILRDFTAIVEKQPA